MVQKRQSQKRPSIIPPANPAVTESLTRLSSTETFKPQPAASPKMRQLFLYKRVKKKDAARSAASF